MGLMDIEVGVKKELSAALCEDGGYEVRYTDSRFPCIVFVGRGNTVKQAEARVMDKLAVHMAEQGSTSCAEWQPIETAPKDGTRIIVSKVNGPVWCNVNWRHMIRKPDRWDSFVGAVPFEPTHWMPLPEPPDTKQ